MSTAIALPRQPHSDWLARIRTVGLAPGGRGVMGLGLGRSSVSAAAAVAPWWLSGGVAAVNAIAVYQPKGAASLAASYVNLANPGTYDAAPGTAPTFNAATGWTFDGSTQYLTTGVTPADGWSAIVRVSDYVQGFTVPFGVRASSTARFYILPNTVNAGGSSIFAYASVEQNASNGSNITTGVIAITKNAGYKDGASVVAISSSTWTGAVGGTISVGARNRGGFHDFHMTGKIQAVAIYNTTLTAPQVLAVSTAMSSL